MAVALAHPRPVLDTINDFDERRIALQRAHQVGAEFATLPPPELGRALLRSIRDPRHSHRRRSRGPWLLGIGTGPARRASTMGLVALVGTPLGQTLLLGGRSPLVWVTAGASGAVLIAVVQTQGSANSLAAPRSTQPPTSSSQAAPAPRRSAPSSPRNSCRWRAGGQAPSSIVTRLLQLAVVGLQYQVPEAGWACPGRLSCGRPGATTR